MDDDPVKPREECSNGNGMALRPWSTPQNSHRNSYKQEFQCLQEGDVLNTSISNSKQEEQVTRMNRVVTIIIMYQYDENTTVTSTPKGSEDHMSLF